MPSAPLGSSSLCTSVSQLCKHRELHLQLLVPALPSDFPQAQPSPQNPFGSYWSDISFKNNQPLSLHLFKNQKLLYPLPGKAESFTLVSNNIPGPFLQSFLLPVPVL